MYVNDRYKEQRKVAGIQNKYDQIIIIYLYIYRASSEYAMNNIVQCKIILKYHLLRVLAVCVVPFTLHYTIPLPDGHFSAEKLFLFVCSVKTNI